MSTFDRVYELSSKSVGRPHQERVMWFWSPPRHWEIHCLQENRGEAGLEELRQKIKRINVAIAECPADERLKFTVDLLSLWKKRFDDHNREEAEKVFGTLYDFVGIRTIATLTADSSQFRVWHGIPACMESDHVDSCGRGLLIDVFGHPEIVARYAKVCQPDLSECARGTSFEIKVPNGNKLYMTYRS